MKKSWACMAETLQAVTPSPGLGTAFNGQVSLFFPFFLLVKNNIRVSPSLRAMNIVVKVILIIDIYKVSVISITCNWI